MRGREEDWPPGRDDPSGPPQGGERDAGLGWGRDDLLRAVGRIVITRWIAAPWIVAQVLLYATLPYPPGVRARALLIAGIFPLGNLAMWAAARRCRTLGQARALALGGLVYDILATSGFVWLYAFDPVSALWAVLFIVPLEGAILFGLAGALGSWGAVALTYVARERWASTRYGNPFLIDSVSFRMGMVLFVALVAGFMARDLLRQRARVTAALEELRRIDAMRRALVSTLAHDVRNPLTAIRLALHTLRARREQMDEALTTEILERADKQAERLERLSLGLLDLARLERGDLQLSLRDVPLREAVERALSYLDDGAMLRADIPADAAVRADPERLEQVVVNLAANALRHGAPPFEIEARRAGATVVLEFRDGGPGVPAELRDSLFEPFRAGDSRGSVGLGLAIVHRIVDAHGGRITYRPNRPTGACFRVELPATDAARAETPLPEGAH